MLQAQTDSILISTLNHSRNSVHEHPASLQALQQSPPASGTHLDVFMQVVVHGVQAADMNSLHAQMTQPYQYVQQLSRQHRRRVVNLRVAGFGRIRTQLKQ